MSIEVRKASDQLASELDRSPSVAELAEVTGFEQEQIIEALDVQTAYRATSIDKPTNSGDDGDLTLGATLASVEKGFEQTTLALAVESLLATLPERERTIVQLRFFEDLSQSEIAERVGVSQMHVSRLLRKSLEQLRERVHASV
jgi:RNA polymerase sigma-B factor